MNFLLDTNVVSEWTRARPHQGVIRWLAETDEDRIFVSVVTLAELRFGVEALDAGARRKRLDTWLSREMPARFEQRILTVDVAAADLWGQFMAKRRSAGRPLGPMDGFIAAIAARFDLALVTRNTSDFDGLGLRLINPWVSAV